MPAIFIRAAVQNRFQVRERPSGALVAVSPLTGDKRWEFRYFTDSWAGVLTTAGGLVFSGDMGGYFIAWDAFTGQVLLEDVPGRRDYRRSCDLFGGRETVCRDSLTIRNIRLRSPRRTGPRQIVNHPGARAPPLLNQEGSS